MKIIVVALRRSGSTIFWKCFRKATQATCFDEPFNPKLIQLPQEHSKQVWKEYIEYLKRNEVKFWNLFSPIYPVEELHTDFTQRQFSYLKELLQQNDNVVIDTTRCWNKISQLAEICPSDTFVIHLHRAPASFVTSHLLPSDDKGRGSFLRNLKRKRSFWTRKNDYNKWGMEEMLGTDLLSAFHLLILKDQKLAEAFYQMPAVYRLLKFWSIAYNQIEEQGNQVFGDRFVSIQFENFCSSPTQTLDKLQKKIGLEFDFEQLPKIQSLKPVYQSDSLNWKQIASYWNLPKSDEFLFRN